MTAGQRSVGVRIRRRVMWAMVAAVAACVTPVFAQAPGGIPGVLAPGAAPELVQEGFTFTEGPVGTADGGLYFSDIRVNKTHYLDPGGKIAVVRENTNGANGLALTKDGELLFAEGDSRKITKRNRDGSITTLTESTPAHKSCRPTTSSSTPRVASISPIRGRARWCPDVLPMCTTCRPAPRRRSWSTPRCRAPTG